MKPREIKKVFLYPILILVLIVSCDISFDVNLEDVNSLTKEKYPVIGEYIERCGSIDNKVSFLFFTDPHLLGQNNLFTEVLRNSFKSSINTLKNVYNAIPFDFCICGGDWIDFGDTQEIAQKKLLFADNYMKTNFDNYYKMMGNHDTNYQGIVSENDPSRGDLDEEFINKSYFSETGSSYYYFDISDTRFIVFDSGIDWDTSINNSRKKQIQWFATTLENNPMKHIIIGIHMFYIKDITPFSKEIITIIDAFNSKLFVNIDGKEYDFSKSCGKIHLILSGHNHEDYNEIVQSIPVVGTCNYMKNNTPNFDLCLINYDEGFFEMFRIGNGTNRKINLLL